MDDLRYYKCSRLWARAEMLKFRVEGMKAENTSREMRGLSLAWCDSDFAEVEAEMSSIEDEFRIMEEIQEERDRQCVAPENASTKTQKETAQPKPTKDS